MNYTEEAKQNFNDLSKNPYPGRGIVLGTSADGKSYVQVYWIMGRSVNSRNRVFEIESDTGFMKTKAFRFTTPSSLVVRSKAHSALASTKTTLRTSRRVFPASTTRMLNRQSTSSPSSRAVTTAKTLAANV